MAIIFFFLLLFLLLLFRLLRLFSSLALFFLLSYGYKNPIVISIMCQFYNQNFINTQLYTVTQQFKLFYFCHCAYSMNNMELFRSPFYATKFFISSFSFSFVSFKHKIKVVTEMIVSCMCDINTLQVLYTLFSLRFSFCYLLVVLYSRAKKEMPIKIMLV